VLAAAAQRPSCLASAPFEPRAFSVVGPTVWNSVPDNLHDPPVGSEQF